MKFTLALIGLSIIFLANSAVAVGRTLEIDSQLFFQGKKIASPRIFAKTGERAKVIMNDQKQSREYNLEVFPVQKSNQKIGLRYILNVREKNNETFSRGEIELKGNNKGRISLDHGRIQIHLKVKKS